LPGQTPAGAGLREGAVVGRIPGPLLATIDCTGSTQAHGRSAADHPFIRPADDVLRGARSPTGRALLGPRTRLRVRQRAAARMPRCGRVLRGASRTRRVCSALRGATCVRHLQPR
jgi:hypothetical protein